MLMTSLELNLAFYKSLSQLLTSTFNNNTSNFIEHCIEVYCQRMQAYFADAPVNVRNELLADYALTEPSLKPAQIEQLETELETEFPLSYKIFLASKCCHRIEWSQYHLTNDFNTLTLFEQPELLAAGYLQFAVAYDGDAICFDLLAKDCDGDYPIISFGHDFVPISAYKSRLLLKPYAQPIADSFNDLFYALCYGFPMNQFEPIYATS